MIKKIFSYLKNAIIDFMLEEPPCTCHCWRCEKNLHETCLNDCNKGGVFK